MYRKFMLVQIAAALSACESKNDVSRYNLKVEPVTKPAWAKIDYWEYGFKEEPCGKTISSAETICEVLPLSQAEIKTFVEKLSSQNIEKSYLVTFENTKLTIGSFAEAENSFICCDIQAPFRQYDHPNKKSVSIAQFVIPKGMILKLDLSNDVTLVGPSFIFETLDAYQTAFISAKKDHEKLDYKVVNIEGFSRDVYVHETRPGKDIDFLIYSKDGAFSIFSKALESYFGGSLSKNIVFIGIESGSVETRINEYEKYLTKDQVAFDEYRSIFITKIVPQVEKLLNFEGGADQRVLLGFSSGGSWVLNYGLDFPKFSSHIISLSPAGKVPDVERLTNQSVPEFFLAAGRQEPRYLEDTKTTIQKLKDNGYVAHFFEEPAGHSHLTWVPAFIKSMEQIFPK